MRLKFGDVGGTYQGQVVCATPSIVTMTTYMSIPNTVRKIANSEIPCWKLTK